MQPRQLHQTRRAGAWRLPARFRSGQRALGKALEQSVRGLRADWEREVNVLIDGAKTDVDLAVSAARV